MKNGFYTAKRKDNGEWIEGYLYRLNEGQETFIMLPNQGGKSHEVDPETVVACRLPGAAEKTLQTALLYLQSYPGETSYQEALEHIHETLSADSLEKTGQYLQQVLKRGEDAKEYTLRGLISIQVQLMLKDNQFCAKDLTVEEVLRLYKDKPLQQ